MRLPVARLAFFGVLVASLSFGSTGGAFAADGAGSSASNDATAGYVFAQRLFRERKFDEVIVALDAFLALHPRDARAFVLRGDAKADLGQNEPPLKDYNVAI